MLIEVGIDYRRNILLCTGNKQDIGYEAYEDKIAFHKVQRK